MLQGVNVGVQTFPLENMLEHIPLLRRERKIYPQSVLLQSADGRREFQLQYDQHKCLTPDQITRVQAQYAAQLAQEQNLHEIWDLGVGSGVFSTQLLLDAHDPAGMRVKGFDIDREALKIADYNLNRLSSQLGLPRDTYDLEHGDWLSGEPIPKHPHVDMIYANPPYLPPNTSIRPEFEGNPWHSLFAHEDGMQHYRSIIQQSQRHLKVGGYLFLRTSKKPELAASVEGMVARMMPASTVEPMRFQSEHREGLGLLVRYYPSEV